MQGAPQPPSPNPEAVPSPLLPPSRFPPLPSSLADLPPGSRKGPESVVEGTADAHSQPGANPRTCSGSPSWHGGPSPEPGQEGRASSGLGLQLVPGGCAQGSPCRDVGFGDLKPRHPQPGREGRGDPHPDRDPQHPGGAEALGDCVRVGGGGWLGDGGWMGGGSPGLILSLWLETELRNV